MLNEKEEEEDSEKALKGEFVEQEPGGLVAGIKIKHLVKVRHELLVFKKNVFLCELKANVNYMSDRNLKWAIGLVRL